MPLIDKIRERNLIRLARKRFSHSLKKAELNVLHDSASSQDLPEPKKKTPRPEIRPEFLRWLATDPEAINQIDPKGIRVYGVTLLSKLDLEGSCIPVRLDFRHCTVMGEINLEQAETRDILFWDSSLEGKRGFRADTIDVHGMILLNRSSFSSEISLVGAKVKGDLDCRGAKLKVTEGDALSMDSAEIGGRFFLREGFETSGTIRMPGAQVKSDFDCTGAKLEVKNEYALFADGAEIRGNALFCKAFESSGKISLRGARVGGKIEFVGATVAQVDCTNLNASGDLYWMKIKVSDATSLDLRGASVKNLYDDEDSWPQKGKGNLFLNELVYEELILEPAPNDAREGTKKRIQWLNRQPDKRYIRPQPWMQLSKYLEARGRHREAKHVLYELMCLQAKNRWPKFFLMRWLAVAFAFLEEWPLRILYSIAFTVLLGWLVFGYAGANGAKGAIAPTKTEARDQYVSKGTLPATYPEWNSFIYTLENAVPLVKLGQDEKWAPIRQYPGTNWFTNYWFLMWSRWLLILSGWVQATVLAAALSGRFKP